MSLEFDKSYNIVSHLGVGRYLTVYGKEEVSNSTRVCLFDKKVNADSQRWFIRADQDYAKVYTALMGGKTYAINLNSVANPKCTMYAAAGNDLDSLVDFITVDSSQNLYRIKLKNYNLYLFSKDMTNLAYVSWQALSIASSSFIWKLVPSSDPVDSSYVWPTESHRITQKFSVPNPFDANKLHRGIDIGAKLPGVAGDNLYSFADGIVARVKNNIDSEGFTVRINHTGFSNSAVGSDYLQTRYLHMQTRPPVREGEIVAKGQAIGKMGSTGKATAAHLHFETVKKSSPFATGASSGYYEGTPIDPLMFFSQN